MAILDFLKGTAPTPAPTQQPAVQQPANTTQQQPNQMLDTGNPPAPSGSQNPLQEGQEPANTGTPANPLDAFSSMFDNSNNKDDDNKAPTFTLPQDKLDEIANGLDFTSGISPELIQKVQGGDGQSIIDLINQVGRQSYNTSIQHMSALSNKFVDARLAHENTSLGSRVKSELTQSELSSTENFSHPAVKGHLSQIATNLSKQYPEASPAEIAEGAKHFLTQLVDAIKDPSAAEDPALTGIPKEVDWDKYLTAN